MELTQTVLPIIFITFHVQAATTSCPNCLHGLCISESNVHCLYGCPAGYWGGKCFNRCTSKGCPPDTDCYRNPPNVYGTLIYNCELCPEGYYRGNTSETFNCSARCPINCRTCSASYECHECIASYYNHGEFRNCSTRCPDRCAACLSPTWCTECIPPYANSKEVTDCSWSCPENCKQCNETRCSSCVNGFFGLSSHCNESCPVNCLACSSGNKCEQCKAGFYNGHEMDDPEFQYSESCNWSCRTNCSECSVYNDCKKCISGTYGSVCEKQCSVGCQLNTCDKNTGTCHCESSFSGDKCCVRSPYCKICASTSDCAECIAGRYGDLCQYECNNNCFSGCDMSSGNCNACIHNTFGTVCENNCSTACLDNRDGTTLCNGSTGLCLQGCREGFYGGKCENACNTGCQDGCDVVFGICNDCIPNTYGLYCENSCSLGCLSESSSISTCNSSSGLCLHGCREGFYGEKCENVCSARCKDGCDAVFGICNDCIPNTYGLNCENSCYVGCWSESSSISACNSSSGLCLHGCREGFYGEKCENMCSARCKEGCEAVFGICNDCIPNTYGSYCKNSCSLGCSSESSSISTCNSSSGKCLTGCKTGLFSDLCDKTCAQTCKSGCDRATGYCDSCAKDKYGSYCNGTCSENCFSKDKNTTRCNQSNGVCLYGCKEGYYGTHCTEKCSENCARNVCNASTGECLYDHQRGDLCNKGERLFTSDELFKKIAIAVVVTCIVTVISTLAALRTVRFARERFTGKGVGRKENRHEKEQSDGTYEILGAGQENQLKDYNAAQNTNSDYVNMVV